MALTISNPQRFASNFRNEIVDIAFDSSYAFGGESFAAGKTALSKFYKVEIEPVAGYTFEYDYVNSKIKVFKPAPAIIIEEQQTIASNQITLNYPAAAILNMASATATQQLIEPADTVAANEVQLAAAMSAGARPTFTFHAATSGVIKTTYITQAWQEVWLNRIASEAVATATHVAKPGKTLCFVESMFCTGPSISRPKFIRGGDTVATLECEVDFSDAGDSNYTTFTFFATDAVTAIAYSGIELPSSGFLYERFVEDEDVTNTAGVAASAFPILFHALCGQIPDYHAAGARSPHHLMMPSGDALGTSQECAIDWHLRKTLAGHQIRTNDGTSDAVSLTYVKGLLGEIPGLVPLEVPNGTDLSALTSVKAHIFGR